MRRSLNLRAHLNCFQILIDFHIIRLVVNLDMGLAQGSVEQRSECKDVLETDDASRANQPVSVPVGLECQEDSSLTLKEQ